MVAFAKEIGYSSGADLRGVEEGGGADDLFRDFTPCRPKASPLCIILSYPFLVTGRKTFQSHLRRH